MILNIGEGELSVPDLVGGGVRFQKLIPIAQPFAGSALCP